MNRILIFLSIILLFVLLAGGVYFFVLRGDDGVVANPGGSFGPSGTPVDNTIDLGNDFAVDDTPTAPRTTLTQIHQTPVAGAVSRINEFEITVGSTTESVRTTVVQYVDQQTGHIFSYNPEQNAADRLSNTTFPGIQEVFWFDDSERVVLRYINGSDEIETYLGEIKDGALIGSYLDIDIPSAQTFENSIATIAASDRGSDIFVADADGRGAELLFETDLGSILIPRITESFVSILTKPVSLFAGSLYFYEEGITSRVLGGRAGLTALPNTEGSFIVFSESTNNAIQTSILDREKNEVRRLPLPTLPEKCVWAQEDILYCMVPETLPSANYPEQWYQGVISFSDALWRINVGNGTAVAVAFFDESGPFDGVNLSVDSDEEYLSFINKKDGSLWGFDL